MKSGFSFIELVIVLAIIGILAVTAIPMFRPKRFTPRDFTNKFNVLMQAAWQEALLTGRVQKIYINFKTSNIKLLELTAPGKDKNSGFTPVTQQYLDSELAIPSEYFFNNLYIEKKDVLRGLEKEEAWFFVMAAGLAQEVFINITDRGDSETLSESKKFGLVLSPFSAQFEYYDTFQHP